jgi:acyl-CoA synthetase (AMP-forming)/AMP-acid ligase II
MLRFAEASTPSAQVPHCIAYTHRSKTHHVCSPCYGQQITCMQPPVSPQRIPLLAQVTTFMNLGPVSPGVEMRITANGGTSVLRELQIGHLQIRGPCVMEGYHNNPKANAECLVGDGWFDSGDLGFIHAGQLVLTGRAKEMIIAYGANYYCYEIEDVVSSKVPGTIAARVAATSVRDEVVGT